MSGVPGSEFESSDEVEILAATSIHRDQETGDDAAECTPKPCSKSLTADHALRRSTGRAQLSSLAANRPTRSSRKCETSNVRSAAPARLPTPARQLPLTCLTGRLLRAVPFVESQHQKYGEEFTENFIDWMQTVDGKARVHSLRDRGISLIGLAWRVSGSACGRRAGEEGEGESFFSREEQLLFFETPSGGLISPTSPSNAPPPTPPPPAHRPAAAPHLFPFLTPCHMSRPRRPRRRPLPRRPPRRRHRRPPRPPRPPLRRHCLPPSLPSPPLPLPPGPRHHLRLRHHPRHFRLRHPRRNAPPWYAPPP